MPLKGRLRPVGDMMLKAESPSSGPGGTPPIQRSDGFWWNRPVNIVCVGSVCVCFVILTQKDASKSVIGLRCLFLCDEARGETRIP